MKYQLRIHLHDGKVIEGSYDMNTVEAMNLQNELKEIPYKESYILQNNLEFYVFPTENINYVRLTRIEEKENVSGQAVIGAADGDLENWNPFE